MVVFKNKEERLSFMKEFLKKLVTKGFSPKESVKLKIANSQIYGCYLGQKHGLPDKMYIGVYTIDNNDYAFLRFWEYENSYIKNAALFKNRENFIVNNSDKIKKYLGKDFMLKSYRQRDIKNFIVDGKDALSGLCAYFPPRKNQSDLANDLDKLFNVLKLIAKAEENQPLIFEDVKTAKQLEEEFDNEVAKINFKRETLPDFRYYGKLKKKKSVTRTVLCQERDPQVVADALWLAKGVCQGCGADENSLFKRASDGSVYLEVHHIDFLSEGGRDTLDNAIALCPTCHRLMHYGKESDIEKIRKNINKKMKEREELIKQILEKQQCD